MKRYFGNTENSLERGSHFGKTIKNVLRLGSCLTVYPQRLCVSERSALRAVESEPSLNRPSAGVSVHCPRCRCQQGSSSPSGFSGDGGIAGLGSNQDMLSLKRQMEALGLQVGTESTERSR